MKNILTILPSLSMGGAEHMAYELIKNLDTDQYSSEVICYGPRKGTILEKQMEAVCKVHYINITGKIGPFQVLKAMCVISRCNPDIVHAHMGGITFAIPWCKLHKKPLVLTVHTRPDRAFSSRNQKQIRSFLKSGRFTIVAVSKENYEMVKKYYGIADDRIRFVNNGIDVERFYRKDHEGFAYVNVARQDENKNQAAIIRCFKKIHDIEPNSKLYLIGDGPCHDDLIHLAKELGIDDAIEIPGLCSTPEDYYAISDVYVQSSHREAMPLSVLEALAAGLPIVSTDVGGLKDVVKGNGKLVQDGDEDALHQAMLNMMELDDREKIVMSTASLKIAQSYSSRRMSKEYEIIYENVLNFV
jgi:glycosyltransferase involved in cell wall biosynthesis